jgi:hypothetical protein
MAPRLGARVLLLSLLVLTALMASAYGVTSDMTGAPSTCLVARAKASVAGPTRQEGCHGGSCVFVWSHVNSRHDFQSWLCETVGRDMSACGALHTLLAKAPECEGWKLARRRWGLAHVSDRAHWPCCAEGAAPAGA